MRRTAAGRWIGGATLTLALVLMAGPALAGATCASATIDEAFLLPDGSLHEAGSLRLCREGDYNPATTLHLGYVDREAFGMLHGRSVGEAEARQDPYLMFVRNDTGKLQLFGYSLPSGEGMETFLLTTPLGGKPRVTTTFLRASNRDLRPIRIAARLS